MKVTTKNVFNELKSNLDRIKKVYITPNFKDKEIIDFIKENKIPYVQIEKQKLDKMERKNQGILIEIKDYDYKDLKDIDTNDKKIIILDHLEDPHNFGAIIRTCESAGIKSIIIPKDRSIHITPTVLKTSTGALEYVDIYEVTNLKNAIDYLKDNGYFIYGAEADGKNYNEIDYADKILLIIGSEGFGLSNIVRKACDEIVKIPMKGHVNSLNASVSAGILIYGIKN